MARRREAKAMLVTVAASVSVLIGGCGDSGDALEHARVSGTVTFDGKPIPEGDIIFLPMGQTKGPSAAGKIVQGRYQIHEKGPVVGTHRVVIHAYRKTGRKIPNSTPPAPGAVREEMINEKIPYIPAQYNAKSTLSAEIRTGDNQRDFELTSR